MLSPVCGFWFLVSGFGFLVSGFWFLVSGFWFLVSGSWFMVYGFGLEALLPLSHANQKPETRNLFVPQRHHRIDLCCAASRKIASQQGDRCE
ncbi:MAG TPA: hypothetical protein VLU47_05235, partial [Blastocatellia bacterium]|nr:hypothetical protein [Blastocatellia bacterium]